MVCLDARREMGQSRVLSSAACMTDDPTTPRSAEILVA